MSRIRSYLRRFPIGWLASLVLLAGACDQVQAKGSGTIVFASASLEGAFEELIDRYQATNPEARLKLHTAGTPQLLLLLREDAPCDVLATADQESMETALAMRAASDRAHVFARNRLMLAVAPGNPERIRALQDLARPELRVALCGPNVPAGRYARRALLDSRVTVRSLSDEPSVRALTGKVALGELDAGVVYATDVSDADGRVEGVSVEGLDTVRANCPIVALAGGEASRTGADFVAFVLSAEGRSVLASFGFELP